MDRDNVSQATWNKVKNIPVKVGIVKRIWEEPRGVHIHLFFPTAILSVKNPLLKIKLFLRDRP